MNKFIQEELSKCTIVIPEFNSLNTVVIPQNPNSKIKKEQLIQKDKYYILELENYILNPPENFTLSSNWNKGINPTSKYLLATYVNEVGKMKCFDACGYDTKTNSVLSDTYHSLWLPEKGFKVIGEVG